MCEMRCRGVISGSSGRQKRRTGLRRRSGSATGKAATTVRAGRIRPPVLVGRTGRRADRPRPEYPPMRVGELRWSSERPNQDGLGWCPSGAGKRSAGTRRGDHRRACRLADVLEDRPYGGCLDDEGDELHFSPFGCLLPDNVDIGMPTYALCALCDFARSILRETPTERKLSYKASQSPSLSPLP